MRTKTSPTGGTRAAVPGDRVAHIGALGTFTTAVTAVSFGAALSIWLIGDSRGASWGPIDDHEIAMFLGPDKRLSPWEIPRAWLATGEVIPGASTRYRPAYYLIRLAETAAWGSHPGHWYGARVLMFALVLAGLVWALRRALTLPENLAVVAFVAGYPFWGDIWARLGPAETYCAVAVALFAVSFEQVWLATDRQWRVGDAAWMCALTLTCVAAEGSKENMLILAVPLAALALMAWRRRSRPILILSLCLIGFTLYMVVAVAMGLSRHGHMYRQDISVAARGAILHGVLTDLWRQWRATAGWWGLGFVAVYSWVRWQKGPISARTLARPFAIAAAWSCAAVMLHLSQAVFYGKGWPAGDHYDFPGALALPLALYVLYWAATRCADAIGLPKVVHVAARAVVFVFFAQEVWLRGFPVRDAVEETVAHTTAFTAKLRRLEAELTASPQTTLIIESYDVRDHEFIVSLERFLVVEKLANPIALRLHGYASGDFPPGSLEHVMARAIESMSESWTRNKGKAMVALSDSFSTNCASVGINRYPRGECRSLGTIP